MEATSTLPKAFIWRRLHSLMGLWLVLFLVEHLLVNSQAAFLLGQSGKGFVDMVNSIHNFPFLEAIEIFLLGVPILVHLVWGVKYLLTARSNSSKTDGRTPSLQKYSRNHAYTWQRITSWILLFMMLGHIAKFRFIEYPHTVPQGKDTVYLVKIHFDDGLYFLAPQLGVELYTPNAIHAAEEKTVAKVSLPASKEWNPAVQKEVVEEEALMNQNALVEGLKGYNVKKNEVIAVAKDFGTASLLSVRDTFKNPIYVTLYTIFVLSACFHAFNGFWTFLITWGVILKATSQKAMSKFAVTLMILVALLGLLSIWGSYFLHLGA